MVNALGVGRAGNPGAAGLPAGHRRGVDRQAAAACPTSRRGGAGRRPSWTHVRANAAPHADRSRHGHPPAVRDGRGPCRCSGEMRGTGETLDDWLTANGAALVGQELVTLSTTPVWSDGGLVPRPMTHARVSGPHRTGLAGDARRLCPHRLQPRYHRHRHAAGRRGRRCLGRRRQPRSRRDACWPARSPPSPASEAAGLPSPRRRQPVLAGPLCRAHRGPAAPDPCLERPAGRGGPGRPAAPRSRAIWRATASMPKRLSRTA